ncbi:MAG: NAD+ synthase [Actinomycetota bacterium]|nr:NAD+ synthase [Actinomycetota bacterium]
MRLALAQINAVVGDLDGNRERILAALADARSAGADLVLFPELAVTGYPPEDLLLRPAFVRAAEESTRVIAAECVAITALVGTPWSVDGALANACAVCADGEIQALYRKRLLPNYGVFDEARYFMAGTDAVVHPVGGVDLGLTVCEDVWQPGPAAELAAAGAELLVNLSASPFHVGKAEEREAMLAARARDNGLPLAFCNLVGGQDELLFDGHSVVLGADGAVLARAPGFEEHLLVADLGTPGEIFPFAPGLEQMRLALGLALRDYVGKNGFGDVVLGLSGGIDSALVAALAAGALGTERVHCVSMPSRYSSEGTQIDARRLAESIGCDFREIPIEGMVGAFHDAGVGTTGLAAENLQARVRGMTLMSLSNEHGWLVLATGNKSELSVGYSTLYGDLAGGFALIKDVYKTDVFRLARHLNERAGRELIPTSIIARPPSAELRDDQKDEDSLPPYDELDKVLEGYVELDRSREELIAAGHDPATVERALALIDRAEYKRRQAPPGVKLRLKAFGRDRRTPITNHWQG